MATGVLSWSQTAASNATADSAINWAEGMAPSAVNDSARATMASVAKWRDDLSGNITTGGTSTAYTVTSNQGLALTAGYVIAFIPHITNLATVTLNVDSLGAKPLRCAPNVELMSGVLVQGTPYTAIYQTSNSGEWILHSSGANAYAIPIGGIIPFTGSTAPNSQFVLPFGQAISRTTYATYFNLVSTTYGTGDGATTFNVPDLRGRSIFGVDNMGGVAASRVTNGGSGIVGTTLGAVGGGENHILTQAELPAVAPTFTGTNETWSSNNTNVNLGSQNVTVGVGGGTNINESTSQSTIAVNITPHGTISNLGSGSAHPQMPPAIILSYILRVL